MSCTREQLVAQARSWLGCNEADGSFKKIIDTYNSNKPLARGHTLKYSDEWCSGFASACAIACGATDIIPKEVSCFYHIDLFKKMGIWVEADDYIPKPGDYIFFYWQDNGVGDCTSGASHVGIVEDVSENNITTIEGNYSCAVKRRNIKINDRYIRGYGVPRYAVEKTVESVDKPEEGNNVQIGDVVTFTGSRHYISAYTGTGKKCSPGKAKVTAIKEGAPHPIHLIKVVGEGSTVYGWVDAEDIEAIQKEPEELCEIALPALRKGSNGETVKALQILLIDNGCSCGSSGVDGSFGTATENAVIVYQEKNNIPVSGICDFATWKKLLGA